MEEGDAGNASSLRDPDGTPGGMKRVTGLDQVGLQLLEHAAPEPWREWQAVVEGAGHFRARNGADPAALQVSLLTGHQQ